MSFNSLKRIGLLALALAVGIVIDDAIVVLENIFKHIHEKGEKPFPAAVKATKEIGLAVLATTLSLIAVFLPVAFMGGIPGRFEIVRREPLVVLMHGDAEVSTKELARAIGVKAVAPCSPDTAQKHTGYMVGGTSPFGTRKQLPIYGERTLFDLPKIYINGGKRGFLVSISPADLKKVLPVREVEVAIRPV